MPDNFSEQLLLLRADFTSLNAMVQNWGSSFYDQQQTVLNTVGQVYDRLDEVGGEMQVMSEQMLAMSQRISQHIATTSNVARAAMTASQVALAESRERFNQLSGRMNLTENRMTGMLGAVDADRLEWRVLYRQLDERLSEVERRLPPD